MNRNKLKQVWEFTAAALTLLLIYWAASSVERGWMTWALSVPPLTIIAITAMARLKDITAIGKRWFVRRQGMILVGAGAISLIAAPMMGYTNAFPSWRALLLFWGVALTWLTTPNMPPWWKYINGDYKMSKEQQG